jgi:hypothetical protein
MIGKGRLPQYVVQKVSGSAYDVRTKETFDVRPFLVMSFFAIIIGMYIL